MIITYFPRKKISNQKYVQIHQKFLEIPWLQIMHITQEPQPFAFTTKVVAYLVGLRCKFQKGRVGFKIFFSTTSFLTSAFTSVGGVKGLVQITCSNFKSIFLDQSLGPVVIHHGHKKSTG